MRDRSERRYAAVPWLADSDLYAMGPAETTVEVGSDITHGLLIREPFGKDTDAMLAIHATHGNGNDGGRVTLAITTVLTIEHAPQPVMDMRRLQSNPRRVDGDTGDADGA